MKRKRISRRKILHVRDEDRIMVERYLETWKRITPYCSEKKEGTSEYYRRVILSRLQNMTCQAIAEENGVSDSRIFQIWNKFKRYCDNKGHILKRNQNPNNIYNIYNI